MSNIILGDYVRDSLTGFRGQVTGMSHYLYESDSVQIQPPDIDHGKPIDPTWLPVGRIVRVNKDDVIGFKPSNGNEGV